MQVSNLLSIEAPAADRTQGFFFAHLACAVALASFGTIVAAATGQGAATLAILISSPAIHLALSVLAFRMPGKITAWVLPLGSLTAFTVLTAGVTGGLVSPVLPWVALVPAIAAVSGHRGLILFAAALAAMGLGTVFLLQALSPQGLGVLTETTLWHGMSALALAGFVVALAGGTIGVLQRGREAIKADRARLQTVTDNIPDLLIRFSADGRLSFVSAACETVLGLTPEELYRQSASGIVHPDEATLLDDALRHGSQFGYDSILECRLRHRDGRFIWHELRCRAILGGSGGEGLHTVRQARGRGPEAAADRRVFDMIISARDISERKRYEHMLEQARDDAERSSLAKSRFLANMSHELRTPLNAIIGFSEVMSEEIFGPLGAKRYNDYAQYIHESGRHLLDLINDVLDLSKIEAGKYEPDLEPVRIPMVVESCLKTIIFAARKGKVKLNVDLPHDLPEVRADQRALRQIMLNLMANAVKFTPAGGNVELIARVEEDMFVIEVKDTGIGIPAHALSRLGQPFEQVGRLLQTGADGVSEFGVAQPGTGLGLSIANSLAQLLGGWLEIESNEGKGTCARVFLPLDGPAQTDRHVERDHTPMTSPAPAPVIQHAPAKRVAAM